MNFSIKTHEAKTSIATIKSGCITVGVFEGKKLTAQAQALDKSGEITAALKSGDISGKVGSTLLLRKVSGVTAERVLLIGLGTDGDISDKAISLAALCVAKITATIGASDAVIALPFTTVKDRDLAWGIRNTIQVLRENSYVFDTLKSKKETATTGVKKFAFLTSAAQTAAAREALTQGVALANGMDLAKTLGNLPGNVCTPTYLANTAKKLAKEFKLGVEILDRKQLEALKMGSFLSVANGNLNGGEPPKFIIMKHMGGKAKDAPVVLVGKGITFDSGGISLKGGAGMDEMKYDMGGAASVFGTFRAIAELKLKLNVIGVVPA
ncbi:MAG: leucyl aminopeptidase, partial [Glaciimonas sp.]|nr:leucyl aminopeptidase [Glaciimonas sp.]